MSGRWMMMNGNFSQIKSQFKHPVGYAHDGDIIRTLVMPTSAG